MDNDKKFIVIVSYSFNYMRNLSCQFVKGCNNGFYIECNNLDDAMKFSSIEKAIEWVIENIREGDKLLGTVLLFMIIK